MSRGGDTTTLSPDPRCTTCTQGSSGDLVLRSSYPLGPGAEIGPTGFHGPNFSSFHSYVLLHDTDDSERCDTFNCRISIPISWIRWGQALRCYGGGSRGGSRGPVMGIINGRAAAFARADHNDARRARGGRARGACRSALLTGGVFFVFFLGLGLYPGGDVLPHFVSRRPPVWAYSVRM